jgi:hypothetical protein
VLLSVELAAGRSNTGRDAAEVARSYGRTLANLVDDDRFPEAAKLFGSNLFETTPAQTSTAATDVDRGFTFGLQLILDGVAAAVDARR